MDFINSIIAWAEGVLPGMKTYLGAAGLFGLAVYQFSQGQYPVAWATLMSAIGLFGLRAALKHGK